MDLLLPHKLKKAGALMAPLGLMLWLAMQKGYISRLLEILAGSAGDGLSWFQPVNMIVAVAGFFSFLLGLYFLAFSKEKIEDEMIRQTRTNSFHFAAFIQMVAIMLGFLLMLVFREPKEDGMMLFFVSLILLFWLSFIARFHYLVHFRYNR